MFRMVKCKLNFDGWVQQADTEEEALMAEKIACVNYRQRYGMISMRLVEQLDGFRN